MARTRSRSGFACYLRSAPLARDIDAVAAVTRSPPPPGSSFGPLRNDADEPADIGHFFMAFDPRLFRDGEEFEHDLDAMIDALHETAPADPDLPVLVAATRRQQAAPNGAAPESRSRSS